MAPLLRLLAGAAALLVAVSHASAWSSAVDVGVNWGSQLTHPLLPSSVVKMLKDNGIMKVKLFDADPWPVEALLDSGIEVMLGIPNDMLEIMSSYGSAQDWVKENVTAYGDKLKLKYVAVGNEPFLKSYNGTFMKTTVPALKNIQKALDAAGLGDKVKATVPLNADVYVSPDDKPSSGQFRPDIDDVMTDMVKFLHDHGAPFVVNIYPFLSLYQSDDFPFEFAFFDGGRNIQDKDGVSYSNVFDANYDTLVSALKKAGVGGLKVVVGEVGWPTDGNKNANMKLARRFYDGLMKKLAKNEGTHLRPGKLDVYLFGLFDEDLKSIAPGNFERHWGILTYDGKPKFPMDLSGQGHDKLLAGVSGVQYLPHQWCVLDDEAKAQDKLPGNIQYACAGGDCTALGYGCSCDGLDEKSNISYAFNMYFQMQDQDVRACDFDGLANITDKNASTKGCLFPVQIISAGGRMAPALRWTTLLALVAHVLVMGFIV
ncbi:glucan endo-1,3-beta-glucosidase 8 [Brachypodium distachyon]|uniref:glucan endo-1,3-beta-D-glucosidase n=1 Tax=Brachypodium distachyon TaxID=15368 RepID=I1GXQ1_BRADI|nr:glucan endo-1,3-beta-glucosidase 8 [Brachypodium distachyon]KQK17850.1 hypothetical protein BRADI_1g37160v3 [Brachypodium distachyon]|eukprot:XP_003560627.1 glucan endo-1,3-beta-glucosidase 8 [Brachypodium distachyon]